MLHNLCTVVIEIQGQGSMDRYRGIPFNVAWICMNQINDLGIYPEVWVRNDATGMRQCGVVRGMGLKPPEAK